MNILDLLIPLWLSWCELVILLTSLFLIDDLFILLWARANKLRPKPLSLPLRFESSTPPRKIAVMIANWKEEDVLERMVEGNLSNIQFANYHFFLGVYPNDTATRHIAGKLAKRFPNVSVVVNSQNGPTFKGQMLNETVKGILDFEDRNHTQFNLFLIHDAEDVIHPLSFRLFDRFGADIDFMQIPVFSLPTPQSAMVAGTYMDEFAEVHTEELLVRDHLKAAIPSAGVGTCLSRSLVLKILMENSGSLFRTSCLTEDYVLGLQAAQMNMRSAFLCYYVEHAGRRDYIATREFFPRTLKASIRQKTRWMIGIAIQGWQEAGWFGTPANRYFLYRDRRSFFNSWVAFNALLVFLTLSASHLIFTEVPFTANGVFIGLAVFNTVGLGIRFAQRMRSVSQVYGWRAAVHVPLRWPVALLVHFMASVSGIYQLIKSQIAQKPMAWAKTAHEVPEDFSTVNVKPDSAVNL